MTRHEKMVMTMLAAAGAAGIPTAKLADALGTSQMVLNDVIHRLRRKGHAVGSVRNGREWRYVFGGAGRIKLVVNLAAVVEMLRRRGRTSAEVSEAMQIGRRRAGKWLSALLQAEAVEYRDGVWHAVEHGPQAIQEAVEVMRYMDARRDSQRVTADAARWADGKPVQRVVPAAQAAAIEKRGPASVWELAA